MNQKKSKSFNLIFSGILLGLFLIFLVGVILWQTGVPASGDPTMAVTDPSAPAPTRDTTAVTTLPTQAAQPPADPIRVNFLLVGRDLHAEGENGRSDSMILCSVDTGEKTVQMISFLRDLYVPIPGHGSSRLNAAYSWGGAELLKQTLAENFGVGVDVNLEIDFEGFKTMIDYLGGVDISLTAAEAKHLNGHYGWSLTEGICHLDGSQALAYSRIRYIDSDFVRTERQQNVLTALLERFRRATLQEVISVLDIFLDESTSNLTDEQLLALMLELYPTLQESVLSGCQIPAEGTYSFAIIRGMSVIEADLEANQAILRELLSDTSEE